MTFQEIAKNERPPRGKYGPPLEALLADKTIFIHGEAENIEVRRMIEGLRAALKYRGLRLHAIRTVHNGASGYALWAWQYTNAER